MKKKLRLVRRNDFARVVEQPALLSGRAVVAFARPSRPGQEPRIGVTVSRQVKTAVARNRVKRRLREVARLHLLVEGSRLWSTPHDIVLLGRASALEVPFRVLIRDAEKLLSELGKPRPQMASRRPKPKRFQQVKRTPPPERSTIGL